MSVEALIAFSSKRNHSGVSQREGIPPGVSTIEAHGSHVLKSENMSVSCSCGFIQVSRKTRRSNLSQNGDGNTIFLATRSTVATKTRGVFMLALVRVATSGSI